MATTSSSPQINQQLLKLYYLTSSMRSRQKIYMRNHCNINRIAAHDAERKVDVQLASIYVNEVQAPIVSFDKPLQEALAQ